MGALADQLTLSKRRLGGRLRQLVTRHRTPVWYDPAYRLPVPMASAQLGIETRRADLVIWSLLDLAYVARDAVFQPSKVRYEDVVRVHTPRLVESLFDPVSLSRIVASDPSELPLNEVIRTFRLAAGATLEAAQAALKRRGPALNLLGGFHHAEPDRAGGLCPINDIAIAIETLRASGFKGDVGVIDLDAHPPDGTAACFENDPSVWIGSLSGSDWGPLPGDVDETLLPNRADDWTYIRALEGLLKRMPPVELTFVIAGGDVLDGDELGRVGMTLNGARKRDRMVYKQVRGQPSVWLPGGGYHPDSWKVLLGTALVLEGQPRSRLPRGYDPMQARFKTIAQSLNPTDLEGEISITDDDLADLFGFSPDTLHRLLGFYTPEGIEYSLDHYGIINHLHRLGFSDIHVELGNEATGDRMRVVGHSGDEKHTLIEGVLEKQTIQNRGVLYIHWFTMMNPRAHFDADKPALPGQEMPGLGLAREAGMLFLFMAKRLNLAGIAYRPAWYHVAFAGRHICRFVDPARQGRFEAMNRDLAGHPLAEVTQAVADGRVTMNGETYTWEADFMVHWLDETDDDRRLVRKERKRVIFEMTP